MLRLAASLTALTACGETPTVIPDPEPTLVVFLSDTSRSSGDAGGSLFAQSGEPALTYVALMPGTVLDGVSAVIRNARTGTTTSVAIVDGGFDPVGVDGRAGDDVETRVSRADAADSVFLAKVPSKRRPTVVRTSPPRGKRDVPLNARLSVVFSEPMDSRTLTLETVQLRLGTLPVAGRLLSSSDGLAVTFVPDAPLSESVDYELVVSATVRDLDGELLGAPLTIPFSSGVAAAFEGQLTFVTAEYTGNIAIINADGSGMRVLTRIAMPNVQWSSEPAWSPDGTRIAFASGAPSVNGAPCSFSVSCNLELYVINADGSGLTRLTNQSEFNGTPAWAPDGSQIAFVSARSGDFWSLHVMNADGSDVTRLAPAPDHPPGTTLLGGYDWAPSWSPDGTKIAFTRSVQWTGDGTTDGLARLCVMNADGTGLRILRDAGYVGSMPDWSPDGTRIAFAEEGQIHVINADGTGHAKLTSLANGVRAPAWHGGPTWSPDGRNIAFQVTHDGGGSSVVVMDANGTGLRTLQLPPFAVQPAWRRIP